jgi:hypothetical protein
MSGGTIRDMSFDRIFAKHHKNKVNQYQIVK